MGLETAGSTRQINGVRLHAVEAGPVTGPFVILLHGFPEFWWAWRHQINPLAERGFHVVAPDMRGYNLSDAPQDIAAYRLPTLVADVVGFADSFGADRFRLVGHDWGGVVAWGVSASQPNRIERLVVMNAPHPDLWTS
jgi:pimeloyl-ACP methyl ester carboxylesterase